MADLRELIERVEGATGADREIDFDIARWLGWTQHSDAHDPVYTGQVNLWWATPGCPWSTCDHPPEYTKSLDAATTLTTEKLPGWDYLFGQISGEILAEVGPADSFQTTKSRAPTPALAIILATLRALNAAELSSGGTEG